MTEWVDALSPQAQFALGMLMGSVLAFVAAVLPHLGA